MRINLLLVVASASLFTACLDAAPSPAAKAFTSIATGIHPTSVLHPQPAAVAMCGRDLHLPTAVSVQDALGDCVATSRGWLCAPLALPAGPNTGDLELAQVWTSTPCDLPAQQAGFFVASFETGEIQCMAAQVSGAQTLCVR